MARLDLISHGEVIAPHGGTPDALFELGLNYCRFTDKSLEALKPLANLKRLHLTRTRTAAVGLTAIASLRGLEELAGVPYPTIARIEQRRVKTPGFYIVAKIAKALGVSLDRLARLKA